MESVKLQKFVSDCGLMSRREAENEIRQGAFTVNGKTASLGDRVIPSDSVKYNGKLIKNNIKKYYIMLNKPAGFVTTLSDEFGRDTVSSLVKLPVRLYPVGRLDKNSEGLLIMTNDGEFANLMTHPRYHQKKRYLVIVNGSASDNAVDMLQRMKELDGEPILPVEVKINERTGNASKLIFTLSEGKNRQIRRMCEAVGLTVMQLKRFAVGNLQIGDLQPGAWRPLTPEEVKELIKNDDRKNDNDNDKAKSIPENAFKQHGSALPDRKKRYNRNCPENAGRRAGSAGAHKDNGAGDKPGIPKRNNGHTHGKAGLRGGAGNRPQSGRVPRKQGRP